jgi:type III secretion system FlhB-like substrate exporter
MIITILQKELLSYNVPTTTDEVNLSPTVESQSKLHAEEWINTAHKNDVKLQKRPKLIRDKSASKNYYVSTKN